MSRYRVALVAAFCLAIFFPTPLLARNVVNTYWYQPHYMAKVQDASNLLQFLSPHFIPGNPYALPNSPATTFTLDKANENNLGLNLFFTETGSYEKSPGLLSLTTVTVPYKKEDIVSIVYADISSFEIRNNTGDASASPWCVVPLGRSSSNNILCVPTRQNAEQVIDALATLLVANGNTMGSSFGMGLSPMSQKELRKHPDWTGCEVLEVYLEGPVLQAGIQADDILHTVNGAPCTVDSISAAILEAIKKPEGGVVHVEILRKGNPMQMDVRYPHFEVDSAALRQQMADLAKPNPAPQTAAPAAPAPSAFHLGISVRAVTATDVTALVLPSVKGVMVTNVEIGGLANQMQMQAGDVILAVNGSEIGDVDFFVQFVRSGAAKSFRVWRKGQTLELTIPQSM
jgi:hypothetical protein